jgi:sterol desaturase/sphingolipid hydroxylase (fatty acid hydroxylase superfamily)
MLLIQAESTARLLDSIRPSQLGAELSRGIVSLLDTILPVGSATGFADAVRLPELLAGVIKAGYLVSLLFAIFFVLEHFSKSDQSRYRSRVFRQDVAYAVFYHGGFYTILIWAGIANALEPRLAFLQINALAELPAAAHVAIYWLLGDFIHYWVHRLEHKWAPLWAIHSVHHVQEEMTFVSTFRMHPLEQLLNNLVMVVPLLIIGVPTQSWFLLVIGLQIFDGAQHSALDWTYGRAYYLLVSPRFHALHHSTDPRHYNGNYGKILSVWDFLFGTGVVAERPARIGVEGLPVPRSLWAQLISPFRILLRRGAEPAPEAPEPPPRAATARTVA